MDNNSRNQFVPGLGFVNQGHSFQIPELSNLSKEEVEDMLASEDKIDEFVENLPQLNVIRNQCDQLMQSNIALANSNLQHKTEYEQNKDSTLQKVEELTSLRNNFDNLTIKHLDYSEKLSPANIQESVLIGAAQSEEESETIAEDFLDNKIDVDSFLNQYVKKRIESHLRKFKGERFGHQLRQLHKAGF